MKYYNYEGFLKCFFVTFRRDPTGQRSSRGQIVQECPMATKFGE